MRLRPGCGLLMLVLFCIAAAGETTHAQPSSMSVSEYTDQLDRWLSSTHELRRHPERASDAAKGLPPGWRVHAEERTFTIPADWLRQELEEWQAKPDPTRADRVSERLLVLRADAIAFQQPAADASDARARLTRILAGREFRGIHGPTWFDQLKQRTARFLLGLLRRAFRSSVVPTISRMIVNTLIVLAVLLLALWMYRTIRSSAAHDTILSGPLPVSAKEWTVWLKEARAAANRGNWRDAIHLAYWCGISYLEARGVWRPDRARTPREYLRLMPASSDERPALAALTQGFELVWYGMQDADADAFAQALAQLKKLGCPST